MTRAIPLTSGANWWPSTLFQTTTLELRRDGHRLLVDPGVSTWEIEDVVASNADPVSEILLTHADWDHVTGIPALPDARVWASRTAAERISSGDARASVEKETAEFYIDYADLDRLRVDQVVDTPAELTMGVWTVSCVAGNGHTPDGLITLFSDERLLVVGDYVSAIEIPWAYSSVSDYRDTIEMLIGLIDRERPAFVVGGHGRPTRADQALAIAQEDLQYLEGVLAFASSGGTPEGADSVPMLRRSAGTYDAQAHAANVKLACETAASAG